MTWVEIVTIIAAVGAVVALSVSLYMLRLARRDLIEANRLLREARAINRRARGET